ncbi:DUF192 domain-containing protein [Halotalea alkalilenta]|uniref:ACR family protein n=1 Tax=Halotalea alkalilenta TaxID=376489 RepID=A0A172YAD5_9GAMM|nr:DUF192 domain-containing protein [Halotalea alkalilenta]ANF56180.1 hypothetical protein A5892_00795 [Halotalea alkalilenta]
MSFTFQGVRFRRSCVRSAAAFLLLVAACFAAVQAAERVPLGIETRTGTRSLEVELAGTVEQRARGLMQRESLPEDGGMLFIYGGREQPASNGYWMYRTLIPLDIAFIGGDGRIHSIRTMEPCRSRTAMNCPSYYPEAPYIAALEVEGGYLERHGIEVGDRIGQGRELLFD